MFKAFPHTCSSTHNGRYSCHTNIDQFCVAQPSRALGVGYFLKLLAISHSSPTLQSLILRACAWVRARALGTVMRWRRRRRRRACGGARRANRQTRKHSNTRTRTQTKPSTRTRAYTHTHTQTRARALTHAATHPRARQQQQHREINTDARKHTPNHSANKADSTRRCKWTKQQRLDEARRAHAKTEKGAAMNKETCQFSPHLIVHVGGFLKTLWPSG